MSDTKKICIICGESYDLPYRLIQHFNTHRKPHGKPHLCPECKITFSTNESFVIHLSRVHCDHNTPVYECSKCDTRFLSELGLINHKKRYHDSVSLQPRTNSDPTTTANAKTDPVRPSEPYSKPLKDTTNTTIRTDQQSAHQTNDPFAVENLNPTMPYDPVWQRKPQQISLEQNYNSSVHSGYTAINKEIFSSFTGNQNAPVTSQVQGQYSNQNLHSVGGYPLQASYDGRATHHQQNMLQSGCVGYEAGNKVGFSSTRPLPGVPLESQGSSRQQSFARCRAPANNHNRFIEQSRCQNALPYSSFQGQSAQKLVSTAEPYFGQFDPSDSVTSRNEAVERGFAEHENPIYDALEVSFSEMDQYIQPFNQAQPQIMEQHHYSPLEEFSVQNDPEIHANHPQPNIQPVVVANGTRNPVGATFKSGISKEEWEKRVLNMSFCSLLDDIYASWTEENNKTLPLSSPGNMEQSCGPNTMLNSWTQGQAPESHLPSAGPAFHNVDTSSGVLSNPTQEVNFSTASPWHNSDVTERINSESGFPNDDLSSTLELSFLDDVEIVQPLDQIQSETVGNYNWSSSQVSHASRTHHDIQQITRTTFADIDTGSYGISEQSSSSPYATSVDSSGMCDLHDEWGFDGNSARENNQFW